MSQKIKLKQSNIPTKRPTVTDLDFGELAINTADGRLFLKKYNHETRNEEIVEFQAGTTIFSSLNYRYIDGSQGITIPSNSLDFLFVDATTTAGISIRLPSTSTEGDRVFICDSKGAFSDHPVNVYPYSSDTTILGTTSIILDIPYRIYEFVFSATDNDWKVTI